MIPRGSSKEACGIIDGSWKPVPTLIFRGAPELICLPRPASRARTGGGGGGQWRWFRSMKGAGTDHSLVTRYHLNRSPLPTVTHSSIPANHRVYRPLCVERRHARMHRGPARHSASPICGRLSSSLRPRFMCALLACDEGWEGFRGSNPIPLPGSWTSQVWAN